MAGDEESMSALKSHVVSELWKFGHDDDGIWLQVRLLIVVLTGCMIAERKAWWFKHLKSLNVCFFKIPIHEGWQKSVSEMLQILDLVTYIEKPSRSNLNFHTQV